MKYLQDLFQKHLGDDVILFTVDPIGFKSDINCGTLPSLFTTIDFGPGMCIFKHCHLSGRLSINCQGDQVKQRWAYIVNIYWSVYINYALGRPP